jgi:NAD(P)-dependent dehydrogenase (short-subunit alcohol dehydrogenase family)
MFSLEGKVAVVTGAAQGIGEAVAEALAQQGAHVVAADLQAKKAEAVAKRIAANTGQRALAVRVDVSDEAQVNEMVEQVLQEFGRIDILVNDAAIFTSLYPLKDFDAISVEEWDGVMAVNLRGTFLCCKAVVPAMRRQQYGRIINVSSSVFWRGIPGFLHYSTSKAGVIGFTRSLAFELGKDGITVNSIAPGYTQSEGVVDVQNQGIGQDPYEVAAGQAIARPQLPEDLVGTFVFLASDAGAFVTGQTLVVDGGLALN